MNETENRITPITRNDIAFNRRHLYESDKVKIGKKTFFSHIGISYRNRER